MFDMQQMGIRISNLRKAAQLTQTELADRLGISFQAVSNWERGLSMPDISKLAELASLLNVTVDALLGGQTGGQTVRRLLEKQPAGDVPVGEIQEIAPILHTDQVETLLGDTAGKPIDADAIASLAPYLSQSFIDDCAEKLLQANGSLHAIAKLAPFVSTSFLDEKAEEALRQTGSLDAIRAVAPFLSEALLDRLAMIEKVNPAHPDKIADRIAGALVDYAYSVQSNPRIAVEVLRQDGPRGIAPLLPFVDSRILVDYLNGALNE